MNSGNTVEIVDRDGWRKTFPLEKPLIFIGSDVRNDIVLQTWRGGGVASRQLQLIAVRGERLGYRAINLGDVDILLGDAGDSPLPPRATVDITDGEHLQMGEFSLLFRIGVEASVAGWERSAAPVAQAVPAVRPAAVSARVAPIAMAPTSQKRSASIGLELSLPQLQVDPERPLEGVVTVRNLGNEPGVQFRLELEGLDHDQYELGAGPILFPGVEKRVFLRIRHPRGPGVLTGHREISIRAAAPEAYPGESVSVSQSLEILPFYSHQMRLVASD